MGCQGSSADIDPSLGKMISLKCCTINLGAAQSPFQFYQKNYQDMLAQQLKTLQQPEKSEIQLNKKFIQLHRRINFAFQEEKLNDKIIHLNKLTSKRYSPLYRKDVGLKNSNHALQNQSQFYESWHKCFGKLRQTNAEIQKLFNQNKKQLEDAIDLLKKFDFLCYQTILSHVYKIDDVQIIAGKNLSYAYEFFMKSKFDFKQFSIKHRLQKLQIFLQNFQIDVAFVHEVTQKYKQEIKKEIEKYRLVHLQKNCQTIILLRHTIFEILQPQFSNYTLKGLNNRYNVYQKDDQQNGKMQVSTKKEKKQIKGIIQIKNKQSVGGSETIDLNNVSITQKVVNQESEQSDQNQESNIKTESKHIIITQNQRVKYLKEFRQKTGQKFAFQFVGCCIFVSIKITIQLKQQQIDNTVWKLKDKLKEIFPQHHIIFGITIKFNKRQIPDQVKFLKNQLKNWNFNWDIFPNIIEVVNKDDSDVSVKKIKRIVQKYGFYTSISRKTHINFNKDQRNKQYLKIDSFIMSSIMPSSHASNQAVYTCQGKKIDIQSQFYKKKHYLPHLKHPFNHFFVYSEINFRFKQIIFKQ